MKIRNTLLMVACSATFMSCSSDEVNETKIQTAQQDLSNLVIIEGLSIEKEDNLLCFSSHEEFNQLVQKIKNNQQITEGEEGVSSIQEVDKSLKIDGFKSIFDNYVSALEEADNYYDSRIHYEEFKNKYSNLYFPEYKDDYSAYLPVSDKDVAKLLNINGEVIELM